MKAILKKNNIKYYVGFYLLIDIILGFSIVRSIVTFGYNIFISIIKISDFETFIKAIIITIVMLILAILILIFITFPVTGFLIAKNIVNKLRDKKNTKYNSKERVLYYREKFDGVSPTTISLVKNLNIEIDKDLSATLMKLQLNKNILIENDYINILSDDISGLTNSEKKLFDLLLTRNLNKYTIDDWMKVSIEEAKNCGYINDKRSNKGVILNTFIIIIMFLLFISGFKSLKNSYFGAVDDLEKYGLTEEMELYEIAEHENFDFFVSTIFQGISLFFCLVGILFCPVFYIVYIFKNYNNNNYKRTEKGEQLADEILGMKRFIHDFSILSEYEKEALVLWNDFLVYAIVLEENKKIIDEILKLKKIKYFDSKTINYVNK